MTFRRFKPSSKATPNGCRISTLNGQILTSTGIASLDELMGGGLPLGRVLMLKQDRYTGYANLILKYWIAQGLAHDQPVAFVSLDVKPDEFMIDLMGIVSGKQESVQEDEEEFIPMASARPLGALRATAASPKDQNLNIAWRYQRLPQLSATPEFRGANSKSLNLNPCRFNLLPFLRSHKKD
jgi:elongator complex protein 4